MYTSNGKLRLLSAGILLALLAGCGGGDDDTGGGGSYDGTGGGGSADTTMQIKLSGAVALLAQNQTVSAAKPALTRKASDGTELFTYEVTSQGLSEEDIAYWREHGTYPAETRATRNLSSGGSNLLAVFEDGAGNSSTLPAIESELPIKVMYSVVDPNREYVYLALDTGWWGGYDGNNYEEFIAFNNCAFYRAELATGAHECVAEGLIVQGMDDNYVKSISGNQKPIQFDAAGNVYFSATEFNAKCNPEDWDGDGIADQNWCYLDMGGNWNPLVYSYDPAVGTVDNVTQDLDRVEFFTVLDDGSVVYRYSTDSGSGALRMFRNGSIVDLSHSSWGVDFFTTDTANTVMWGGWSENGIRFATPRAEGGANFASLNTSLFGGSQDYSPSPNRVLVADDGRLYGVFSGVEYDSDGSYARDTLTVYQVLPYDGVPKAKLTLTSGTDWWTWMQETTFQVANGYLFYVEKVLDPHYLEMDVIRMVRLSDRTTVSLFERTTAELDLGDSYYDIYNWRLSGGTLYFSALDKATNNVVSGEIDTVALGSGSANYLSLKEVASAAGAAAKIKDIEVLTPDETSAAGIVPVVDQFHANPENLYSVSLDFNTFMDQADVLSKLSLTANPLGTPSPVEYLPVWIYKSLHLIPDTNGLSSPDLETVPLDFQTDYQVTLAQGAANKTGSEFTSADQPSEVFTTRPGAGWYPGTSSATNTAISDVGVATYAGPATDWDMESYNLGVDVSGDVRIEFSAKNLGWAGANVWIWNQTRFETNTSTYAWDAMEAYLRLEYWSSVEYRTTDGSTNWTDQETPNVFNGTWQRYRIELIGTNLTVERSEDNVTWHPVLSASDLRSRSDTTAEVHKVLLRVREPMLLDNVTVTALNTDGSDASVLMDENFNSGLATINGGPDDGIGLDNDVEGTDSGGTSFGYGDLDGWW